jgi:nitrite reductase (NO-forming)
MTGIRRKTWAARMAAAALAGAVLGHAPTLFGTTPVPERAADTRVYGAAPAEIFTDDYAGPPVTGDAVSVLPELAPLAPGNRTHQVRIDVLAQQIEVAPGVRYNAWTFGGTVPGPVVHVREGDRVVFTMKNRTNEEVPVGGQGVIAPMAHSIDFHAAMVAPNDKYRMIRPGESIRFEWVANYPGVYTYHCGVPPILHHVAMGQYGIVVVSPREGYATDRLVAREYAVVQSEFYLKRRAESELYAFDGEAAREKEASHVVFNGHASALKDHPLMASPGERVRLYLHNVGPSGTSSAHVVGTILDRVWGEGNPANDWRGMQTVLLGASNGAVVEFIVPEEGDYFLVDHEFADAQKGAVGIIRARSKTGTDTYSMPSMSH